MESLEEIMGKLPSEHQREVRANPIFLAEKRARPKAKNLRLAWAGDLKGSAIYTSPGTAEDVAGLFGR